MIQKKPSDRHKIISEYVEMLYPNVSNAEKEALAKTFFTELSDGAISELRRKMEEEI